MKISYNWLKEFTDFDATPKETAELITFAGIETNLASGANQEWPNVVTAKVVDAAKHPQADKLSVCTVNDGTTAYTVVCGAPNVAAGQTVAFAKIGAELPGDFKIKKAKIRGVESEGMICSEKELGLSDESNGIMVLDVSAPLGKPLKDVLGNSDTILEIEIPTNRPDALSHLGIAREIAAKNRKNIRLPEGMTESLPLAWKSISIKDSDLCSRYIGIKITGIKVGPSPDWMADKLKKCGLRPINNVVDITNYVLFEMGHPLHAFDSDKLNGDEIIVRRAVKGEKMLALDGKMYQLEENMLVISDADKPQAIAGVMGAETSGVKEGSVNMILESAIFKPASIRKTSKTLNLSTDASYRFERGTGWTVCEAAALRAAKLITELTGGKIESMYDLKPEQHLPASIELRPVRIKKITGLTIERNEIVEILTALGMKVTDSEANLKVEPPSWRIDVTQEIDLIEEVARVKGYDVVPTTFMQVSPQAAVCEPKTDTGELLSGRLMSLGFSEAVNYSFAEEKDLALLKLPVTVRVANPLSKENEAMRPSLLPGLWRNLQLNRRQGCEDVKLFEQGTVFIDPSNESRRLGIIAVGGVWPVWWGWEGKPEGSSFDFYYFGGVLRNILSGNHVRFKESQKISGYYHPGKTASIEMNGRLIGELGMLHPEITRETGKDVAYAEIDLGALELCWNRSVKTYKPVSRKPSVKRDISVLAKKSVQFDKIVRLLDKYTGKDKHLSEYELFSKYEDDKIGNDNISYSFHLIFRDPGQTLTDAQVSAEFDGIVSDLNKELGITLR